MEYQLLDRRNVLQFLNPTESSGILAAKPICYGTIAGRNAARTRSRPGKFGGSRSNMAIWRGAARS